VDLPRFFRDGYVGVSVEEELRHRQPDEEANAHKHEEAGCTLLIDEVSGRRGLPEKEARSTRAESTSGRVGHRPGRSLEPRHPNTEREKLRRENEEPTRRESE